MADVDQAVRHAKLRDLAPEWCGSADGAIRDRMGEGVSGYDRSVFYLAACAEMGARAYDAILKDEGLIERSGVPEASALSPEQRRAVAEQAAQALLKSVFALMSGLIRNKGHDVQLSAKLTFAKVDNHRAGEATEDAAPERGGPECRCALDQDGRCAECSGMAREFFTALLESVRAMLKVDRSKVMCPSCAKVCVDQVLARIVREELSGLGPEMSEHFMNGLLMGSQTLATAEMPLTKRAWAEIQREGKA